MKILQVVDCRGWAIDSLAQSINKYLSNRFTIKTIYAHPREITAALPVLRHELDEGVDLINFHYWRSAVQLLGYAPELKKYPKILSHWNHESLEKDDWSVFDALTHPTKYGYSLLKTKYKNVYLTPMGIDLDRFSFIKEYPPKEIRIGYVGRIVPWKRLDFICECCKELGYKVLGSGYIDKANYFKEKIEKYITDGTLEFNGGAGRGGMMPVIFKDNLYKKMTVFVMASEGEYESGPLPAQEAMARGVPVLATCKGTLKDRCSDGKNIIFFEENNKEDFKAKLKMLVENKEKADEIRREAWKAIKNYPEEKMAWEFGKLYYKVYSQKNEKK